MKTGDIVFRGASKSELSSAINDVTQTAKKNTYTHMGICEVINDKIFVYHSDLGKGVVRESLEDFYKPDEATDYSVDLYRIKTISNKQIASAITKARALINKPYNVTYILEDEGFYCSEYIYELFKNDSVFKLEPMTFKNPKTKTFHDGWVKHYNNLGIAIPEGKLGCNPNGMASSENLEFIGKIN
ncbi:hypothetical protein PK35_12415 [Tamlana nanhaiensis]|uniref:Peptidoglycan peptidase n=1 Tax=Neotamlana nanhaiensis TaxID=1382798 RepID=A0A0D7VZZ2_9FLAO|nr:hypothetical protein PK35_12415 [Tamlana nanhaiensis]